MIKTILLCPGIVFCLIATALAYPLFENSIFSLEMDAYLRTDLVSLKNVTDLDSHNRDDHARYLGIDYSLGFKLEPKSRAPRYYLKLERNGPGDYSAPLFIHNTLQNSAGRIERYRDEQLLPEVEELWMDAPLGKTLGFKIGLYAYEVGNGFSLNGSYENYGAMLYQDLDGFSWHIYYCRPEVVYKNRRGPKIPQDREQGYYYHHNAANFYSADLRFSQGDNYLQPYIGVLSDYTSPDKRDNAFSAPIKKDFLGTLGIAAALKVERFFVRLEMARNFGYAESENPLYKEITHAGYFAFTELGAHLRNLSPSFQFMLASGNKVPLEQAGDSSYTSGRNMAFSSYSPLNKNIGGSISACNAESRPIVVMGSGCGLHVGLPRPRTLASSDFDNLIMPSLGFDLGITKNLKLGLRNYYIISFARPVGTLGGEARYLSRELGDEIDLWVDYRLNKNTTLSFLGGYFIPGRYYREKRDDASGSLFSPYLRGDGNPNAAYQLEFSLEFQY